MLLSPPLLLSSHHKANTDMPHAASERLTYDPHVGNAEIASLLSLAAPTEKELAKSRPSASFSDAMRTPLPSQTAGSAKLIEELALTPQAPVDTARQEHAASAVKGKSGRAKAQAKDQPGRRTASFSTTEKMRKPKPATPTIAIGGLNIPEDMPLDARPQPWIKHRGTKNYHLYGQGGAKVQVELKKNNFWITGWACAETPEKCVSWQLAGGVAKAWDIVKARTAWVAATPPPDYVPEPDGGSEDVD